MNRINLLPDSYVAHARRSRTMRTVMSAGAVVLIVGVAWGAVAYDQIRALDQRVEQTRNRLTGEHERSRTFEQDRAAMTQLRALLAHRGQLEAPVPAHGVLALLTHLLPESVAVTRLSMDVPPADLTDRSKAQVAQPGVPPLAPPEHVPSRIEMEGVALSDVELAKVVGTLASHKAFANVKLVRSRQVMTDGLTRYAFQITLDVPAALPATNKPLARTAEKDSRGA